MKSTNNEEQNSSKTQDGKKLTIAELELQKHEKCYNLKGSFRKSRRISHKIKTSRLRRLREMFWDNDSIYDYTPPVPNVTTKQSRKKIDFKFGTRLQLKRIHDSPHIYTIDNFLTKKEVEYLEGKIKIAEEGNMFTGSFVDKKASKAIHHSKQRTSTFIHFSKLSNSKIAAIENRAADLLSFPNHSIEPLQIVRYNEGQYFQDHHDMGVLYEDGSVELPPKSSFGEPRRLVTILVYLNDMPHADCGGSTRFPLLKECNRIHYCKKEKSYHAIESESSIDLGADIGLDVYPKRGMALLWCNIKKDGMPDDRVVHSGQALNSSQHNASNDLDGIKVSTLKSSTCSPVTKYAMNIWACED